MVGLDGISDCVRALTETEIKLLEELGTNIEQIVGIKARKKAMQGFEEINPSSKEEQISEFASQVISRLDELVEEPQRDKIMRSCGHDCLLEYSDVIEEAKLRRSEYKTINEFLKAEEERSIRGIKIASEKGVIHQTYQPQSFEKPMRCYCMLFRHLPSDKQVSSTFCHCSEGFVKEYWQEVLDRPIKVKLLQSAITGGDECVFEIRFED
jgi:predicted hydrocarbon binding protein